MILNYSLIVKRFDYQTNWMVMVNMRPDFERINDLLVEVFNDILVIEESELRKSRFNDLTITEMHTLEAIGMYRKKTTSEVAKAL